MPDQQEHVPARRRLGDSDELSLGQIARAGVVVFGYLITLMGIVFLAILFKAVYDTVFSDAVGLKVIFEKWREIVVPEGVEPSKYDQTFPVTTVLAFAAMALPVLFLSWLAAKVIAIGIKVASPKHNRHDT